MNILQPLLAQTLVPTDVIQGGWHWMGLTLKELLILLGAVSIVVLIVFIWAVYIRKTPRRHSHHHHHHHHSSSQSNIDTDSDQQDPNANEERRYRRKRRRRREHRPRNPTLAETGGLPPLRTERPPDPLP